ncbi:MFS transporter [Streptomyces sclerotialus]|uniref:MFS transporter n=1 Tax=Streptomyces sclerotialus TaxID=1957 RepID=UPI0004CAC5C0
MKKAQLAFLTSTHTVNDLYQGAVPALLPYLMAQRGYSYTAISGIALAVTGLSTAFQPLFGLLSDRKARSWLVPAGFLTAGAGVSAVGLVHGYLLTWLCVAAAGVGLAAFHPPATSQARVACGRSQKGMSVFSVGGTFGASLAPALVTVVVGSMGLSGSPLLVVPAVVMAVLWGLRSLRARRTEAETGAAGAPAAATGLRDDWRSFGRLVAVVVGWSVPYVSITALVSLYAQRTLHAGSGAGAAVLTSFTAAGAVGTLLGGWVADRWGRLRAVRTGYLLGIVALAGVVWSPSFEVLAVSTLLCGVTMFLPFAPQVTLAQDYLPNRPGTASGLTLGLAMSVGGLTSPLFGVLADAQGLRAVFATALAVFAVAALLAFRLPDRRPAAEGAGGTDGTDGTDAVAEPAGGQPAGTRA